MSQETNAAIAALRMYINGSSSIGTGMFFKAEELLRSSAYSRSLSYAKNKGGATAANPMMIQNEALALRLLDRHSHLAG